MGKSSWYLAPSLVVLRNEINKKWPNRDKKSDGTIGDDAHSSRTSQHNPNAHGAVCAIDTDRDGISPDQLVSMLIVDDRVWYVIYNRRMYSRSNSFRPVVYRKANPHTGHVHVSLRSGKKYENDTRSWRIADGAPGLPMKPANTPKDTRRPFSLHNVVQARLTGNRDGNTGVVQTYLNRNYINHGQGRLTVDEYWGDDTQRCYDAYRRYIGYTGDDALGAPGASSLQRLLSSDYRVV